jgi:hypothetical protein
VFGSLLIVAVAAAIGLLAWRRTGYEKIRGLQELLRTLIVGLIVLLLSQPEWVAPYQTASSPSVVVLWDDSPSMQTRDVPQSGAESPADLLATDAITRAQAIHSITDQRCWATHDATDRQILIQPLGQPTGTDLCSPLADVLKSVDQLLAVVLISDGDWNSGEPPVTAAAQLLRQNIPLHTVYVGSAARMPDLDLQRVETPTFGIVEKPVRIPFTIESSLTTEFVASVKLEISDGQTLSRDIRIAPLSRTTDAFSWTPTDIGDYTATVTVPQHAGETIVDNNQKSSPIVIRKEQLKVLIIESYPRWEYRYLRNALSRDAGVEVACLLFQPGLEKVGGGSLDYLKVFPESIEELSQYDVVIVGDVGTEAGQLTEDQCSLLAGLVEHQAAGLVFIPGFHGNQFDLLETELGTLMPVVLDAAQPTGWGARTPGHFELTERGRRSLLTRLADTDNADVWGNLPGFQWYAPVIRATAGSEVLAVHRELSNDYGRLPLLVTRTFGSGKVLFMGTDGAWRWRKGVEDKYHYRFWGQVVRWMAYQRKMAEGERMRFIHTPDQPQQDQVLSLLAHVMDDSGEPLETADVRVMIDSPGGRTESLRLRSAGDLWGAFEGQFTPRELGRHAVTVSCDQTTGTLQTSFFVHGSEQEPIGKPARPDVLGELSRITGGRSVRPDQIEQIIASLTDLPDPPPTMRRWQLWNHPLTAILLIALLGLFWTWRKMTGLI